MGRRAKTDPIDARTLAQYGHERKPPGWAPLAQEVSELDSLLERKRDLEHLIGQERSRLDTSRHKPAVAGAVPASIESVIQSLEDALGEIERAIKGLLDQYSVLKDQRETLLSVPGIGQRNVLWVLVLMHRWQTLTRGSKSSKSLVAYIGLDPSTKESGTSIRGRKCITRIGDRWIRRMLYMGALGGKRGDNALRAFYERLVARGKPKKVALVAAARKILIWAWQVFHTNKPFEPALAVTQA